MICEKAIDGVFDCEYALDQEIAQEIVSKIDVLPTIPEIYQRLRQKLDSSDSTIADIAAIISTDVGMSAKVLQLVNSSFFSLKRRVETVREAVIYLGFETIKSIVLYSYAE